MSVVSIPVNTSASQPTSSPSLRPKMVIFSEFGLPLFVVPYAPRELTHDGLTPGYSEQERALGKPLLIRGQGMLRRMGFEIGIQRLHHQESIEDLLADLQSVMNTAAIVYVVYGPQETGCWRPNTLTISVLARNEDNEITKANCALEFNEASDPPVLAGPTSGGLVLTDTEITNPIINRPSTYTVKTGDTLTSISITYYGNAFYVSSIAAANGIKTTTTLTKGKVLKLP